MTPPSDPSNAPLQALFPTVIAKSQLVLSGCPSSDILTDLNSPTSVRSPQNNAPANPPLHLHHPIPELPTKYKHGYNAAAHIHDPCINFNASASSSPSIPWKEQHEEPRQLILSSFAPRVALYTSTDTADFIKLKGFNEGLVRLLRPFAEHIQGKVVIRDSIGSSRGWHDFGIRFIDPLVPRPSEKWVEKDQANGSGGDSQMRKANSDYDSAAAIDRLIGYHFGSDNEITDREPKSVGYDRRLQNLCTKNQSLHILYLRKLLSSMPMVPYETFAHPVACVIAISSRNSAPLETLHHLYDNTVHDGNGSPAWMSTEYLRYYVLMHDEENDDITKSTALFDLMKRHFGLHCHLLRLRSSHCVATDDDSIPVPPCEWLTAEEELAQISRADLLDGAEDQGLYIHESDATAIRNFLREMVTQSIVPFMESRVMTWNEQLASRRRGISGRFMSISKRLASFGSLKATHSSPSASSAPTGSNFDTHQGFYSSETSEATMRQLADYAFMLRDWKLAYSIYDFLRADFRNDSAWLYYAAANEMFAISYLLIPQNIGAKVRSDTIDQMLEIASYSYLTRCSKPSGVIRCLTIATELLQCRGSTTAEDAAKWGAKLLELGVLSPIAQVFITERIADCYRSRSGAGLLETGSRKRQTALWDTLAAKSWVDRGLLFQSRGRLQLASISYRNFDQQGITLPFPSMRVLWEKLEQTVYGDNEDLLREIGLDASMVSQGSNLHEHFDNIRSADNSETNGGNPSVDHALKLTDPGKTIIIDSE